MKKMEFLSYCFQKKAWVKKKKATWTGLSLYRAHKHQVLRAFPKIWSTNKDTHETKK